MEVLRFQRSRRRGTSSVERVGDLLLKMTKKSRALDAVRMFVDGLSRALLLQTSSSRLPFAAALKNYGKKAPSAHARTAGSAGGSAVEASGA